jgi:hypothetical protein
MASTVRVFDFDIDSHGAAIVVAKEPLCPRCMSAGEVDAQIRLLKADLDAAGERMKGAIKKGSKQSDFA